MDATSKPAAATQKASDATPAPLTFEGQVPRLEDVLNALAVAIYTTDAEGRITFCNEAAVALWGRRPDFHSDGWCGSWKLFTPDGAAMAHDECPMAIALKERRAISGGEAVAERPDGTRVPFVAFPSPLHDAEGTMIGAVNMLIDVSERERAERAAQHLAAVVESSDDAIISKSLQGVIQTWNKGAQRLFGYTAEEAIGQPVTILIPAERADEEPRILERIRSGDRVDDYDTMRRRKDGTLVPISLTVSPVKNRIGLIVGASKIARDISERKQDEERIRLLAAEVDHRAKNLLALVQATVHLSQAESAEALKAAIEGRLRAIANAHSLFAQSHWAGASLRTLVSEELAAFTPIRRQGRVQVNGPDVAVTPNVAQALAMVVHELATNAAKYGALSSTAGQVQVEWTSESDQFVLRWRERGGPTVAAPTRSGFGTKVIEQLVRTQLRGKVTFDWQLGGLVCTISLPGLHQRAANGDGAAGPGPA